MLASLGWVVAVLLGGYALRLRRRLDLVADAEHELRGPLTAFGLALDSARGTPVGRRLALVLDAELARARAALADLAAARTGDRPAGGAGALDLDRLVRSSAAAWGARFRSSGSTIVRGDRSRLAQALGNLLSNAREHGAGEVTVRTRRTDDGVRIEVTNPTRGVARPERGRGRGLRIAARAARESGGRLTTAIDEERATAVIELPLESERTERPHAARSDTVRPTAEPRSTAPSPAEPPRVGAAEPPAVRSVEPPRVGAAEPPPVRSVKSPRVGVAAPPPVRSVEPLCSAGPPPVRSAETPRIGSAGPSPVRSDKPPRAGSAETPRVSSAEPSPAQPHEPRRAA